MSDMKRKRYEVLMARYNELVDKYNSTESWSLKGYYAGEMVILEEIVNQLVRG